MLSSNYEEEKHRFNAQSGSHRKNRSEDSSREDRPGDRSGSHRKNRSKKSPQRSRSERSRRESRDRSRSKDRRERAPRERAPRRESRERAPRRESRYRSRRERSPRGKERRYRSPSKESSERSRRGRSPSKESRSRSRSKNRSRSHSKESSERSRREGSPSKESRGRSRPKESRGRSHPKESPKGRRNGSHRGDRRRSDSRNRDSHLRKRDSRSRSPDDSSSDLSDEKSASGPRSQRSQRYPSDSFAGLIPHSYPENPSKGSPSEKEPIQQRKIFFKKNHLDPTFKGDRNPETKMLESLGLGEKILELMDMTTPELENMVKGAKISGDGRNQMQIVVGAAAVQASYLGQSFLSKKKFTTLAKKEQEVLLDLYFKALILFSNNFLGTFQEGVVKLHELAEKDARPKRELCISFQKGIAGVMKEMAFIATRLKRLSSMDKMAVNLLAQMMNEVQGEETKMVVKKEMDRLNADVLSEKELTYSSTAATYSIIFTSDLWSDAVDKCNQTNKPLIKFGKIMILDFAENLLPHLKEGGNWQTFIRHLKAFQKGENSDAESSEQEEADEEEADEEE